MFHFHYCKIKVFLTMSFIFYSLAATCNVWNRGGLAEIMNMSWQGWVRHFHLSWFLLHLALMDHLLNGDEFTSFKGCINMLPDISCSIGLQEQGVLGWGCSALDSLVYRFDVHGKQPLVLQLGRSL